MFNQNGLSLDQAPPISVVFTFFFTGALFGILSGLTLFMFKTDIYQASSTAAVTFTHLLTLGVMMSFMFAALFQILPVIAGVKLSSPLLRSKLLLYPFILGVCTLLLAFNFTRFPWLYLFAALLLGTSIILSILPMLYKLSQIEHHSASSKGMIFSLLSLVIVLSLALYLLATLGNIVDGVYYLEIKKAHYSFGLFGWIALLIISISFQVIEMFYVTPSYPNLVSSYLPLSLFTLLLFSTLFGFFTPSLWTGSHIILAIILITYALLTLLRLTQKKRPLSDATVWFWKVGLGLLIFSMLSMSMTKIIESQQAHALCYIFFTGFALSIVFAMFYKIVPFLTWFHLSSQGYFTAPMMHEVIHPKTAMKHLYIHMAAIVTFVLSIYIEDFIFLAALLTMLSFGWMAYQINHAWKLYKHTQETGEKFEMGNIN